MQGEQQERPTMDEDETTTDSPTFAEMDDDLTFADMPDDQPMKDYGDE